MGKLKAGKCLYCKQPIQRHDTNRVVIEIGRNNGVKAHRLAHLACTQNKED